VALLALVLALLAPGISRATTYANFNREAYTYTSALPPSQEANTYQYMVLLWPDAAMVPILKAANPNLKIFMYEGIMAAQNSNPAYVTCTSGPWVLANHPNWILTDQNGNPILYQGHYLLDVANPSYQQTCLANSIAEAKKDGFDGVFWDMANAKLVWVLPPRTSVPEYPTDASWQAAMYSMLSYAGTQLHANGLLNVANIGGGALFKGLWQQWNGPLDGAEEESFTDYKLGLAIGSWDWPQMIADTAWSEANHKFVMLHSWNTTEPGNTYGLASMMLVADGESSWSTSNGCYSTCEVWYPEYTTAQQLGAPLAPYTKLANGAYERRYQYGMVVVNPTLNAIAPFSLGGGTYTGSGLSGVSSVGLGADSGYILLADPPTIASPPTISGTPATGATLTATLLGSWTPGTTTSYQWERCTASCVAIAGATANKYVPDIRDVGSRLAVVATVANASGNASAKSAETSPVSDVASQVVDQGASRTGAGTGASKNGHGRSALGLTITLKGRTLVLAGRLDARRLMVAATCPRRLRVRCAFMLTLYPTLAPSSVRGGRPGNKVLGHARVVLLAGQAGTFKLRLTAAARRMLACGHPLRIRILIRMRYGHRLATLAEILRIAPPAHRAA
jgi:hypothetical protein